MTSSETFVTADWLASELDKPDVVVVDGSWYLPAMNRDGRAEYQASHIPGAVYFDIDEVKDINSPLPHMLPPPEVFSLHMARLGISDGQRVVVYDGAGLFSAPRVWFTFKVFGAKDVLILDGGLPAWKARNYPLQEGTVIREPGSFTPKFSAELVADIQRVQRSLNENVSQLIDARPAARFRGEEAEPRAGVVPGHIPGSINVPSSSLVRDGRLAPRDEIKRVFDDAGFDPDKPVIASCGSGVSAAILWLALEAIGIKPAALYDGSWSEWGTNPTTPKATGGTKKP